MGFPAHGPHRAIENEFLGLKNGVLDQSAILLSREGHLTCVNCRHHTHTVEAPPWLSVHPPPVRFLLVRGVARGEGGRGDAV